MAILVSTMLILSRGCATGKKTHLTGKVIFKELSGTWINKDYDGYQDSRPSKFVVKRNGTWDVYQSSDSESPIIFSKITAIVDTWIDFEENIWYKATFKPSSYNSIEYMIGKISNSGTVWELVWSVIDFPDELNPNHVTYEIRYRQ